MISFICWLIAAHTLACVSYVRFGEQLIIESIETAKKGGSVMLLTNAGPLSKPRRELTIDSYKDSMTPLFCGVHGCVGRLQDGSIIHYVKNSSEIIGKYRSPQMETKN